MKKTFKSYFFKGLLIWIPIVVTVFVIRLVANLINNVSAMVPSEWLDLIPFSNVPGAKLFLACLFIVITGAIGSHFIGKVAVKVFDALVRKLPLVGTVYHAVKKILTVMFSDQSKAFKQVVMVEYPRKGCYSLGFVTSDQYKTKDGKALLTVLIVTTPNPTSGFVLLVPEDQVKILDMTVEEGLRYVISLGTAYDHK